MRRATKNLVVGIIAMCCLPWAGMGQEEIHCRPADPNKAPRERLVDYTHLDLTLAFELKKGAVKGKVVHSLEGIRSSIDSLIFDAPGIMVDSLWAEGVSLATYKTIDNALIVYLNEPLKNGEKAKIHIHYRALPQKGIYFIGWNDTTNRARKGIWTQGQGIDNRHWIPMFDELTDKITTDIKVQFPAGYKVLSNGKLVSNETIGNNQLLWHYRMDTAHSPYLIMLGIGDYVIDKRTSASGVPMQLYMYSDWKDRIEPTYRYTEEIFNYLESEIGLPYPWESYAQVPVRDFLYGAMENTTATVFGDFFCVNSKEFEDINYVYVNAHELAHQWFGNYVTARSAHHHWLHESFATYYHHLAMKKFLGDDEYIKNMRGNEQAAFAADAKDSKGIAHSQAGSSRHYLKGSYVLRMLRYVVGDEDFKKGILAYLKEHPYAVVESDDLLYAYHDATGHTLDWFWEQWVYGVGNPEYEVETELKKDETRVTVRQVQEQTEVTGLFKMPVVFEVLYEDHTKDSTVVWIEKAEELVVIPNPDKKAVRYVVMDPSNEILGPVRASHSVDELTEMLLHSNSIETRLNAAEAMNAVPMHLKKTALLEAFDTETSTLVKAEIVKQFAPGVTQDKAASEVLRRAIMGYETTVTKAALSVLDTLPQELVGPVEACLKNSSSYVIPQMALMLLHRERPEDIAKHLKMTQNVRGNRGESFRVTWLTLSYATTSEQQYLNELVDLAGPSYEFITRMNASRTLQRLNHFSATYADHMIDGYMSKNRKLRGHFAGLIKKLAESKDYKKAFKKRVKASNLSDADKDKLFKLLKAD